MKVNVTKKIGKSTLTFQLEGDKERDTLAQVAGFTTMPDVCGHCGSDDLTLDSNKGKDSKGKEYTFVKIKCNKCNFRSNMGELVSGGIFWKDFEQYVKPVKNEE